ncbi:hypothetical protein [Armatimonas sp.]|uniref:hypothetical protein n=1 Tax=Armatimonas sp. TaxID=1872638 RepID=UPI003752B9F4
MKHAHFSLTCLPVIALLATASGAHAKQADPRTNDEKVMDAITQKLRVMVGEDATRRGKVGSTTLILYRPGLVITLSEEQKTNPMEIATYLNLVCNRLPAATVRTNICFQ